MPSTDYSYLLISNGHISFIFHYVIQSLPLLCNTPLLDQDTQFTFNSLFQLYWKTQIKIEEKEHKNTAVV